jgi:hypothetical protein
LLFALVGLQTAWCQPFNLTGHESLSGPGDAQLILQAESDDWENQTLRVEFSGPTEGVLVYERVEDRADLGFFYLQAGNYTFDIYVLEKIGPTVELSGSVAAHETLKFSIPSPPPEDSDNPLIDPVNLGFMLVALFIFGLLVIIARGKPVGGSGT